MTRPCDAEREDIKDLCVFDCYTPYLLTQRVDGNKKEGVCQQFISSSLG